MMKVQTKRRAVVFTNGVAMRVWADGGQGLARGQRCSDFGESTQTVTQKVTIRLFWFG